MPFGVRMAAGTSLLLIAIGGSAAGMVALTREKSRPPVATAVGRGADAAPAGQLDSERLDPPAPAAKAQFGADAARSRTSEEADRTATRRPHRPAARGWAAPAQVKAAAVPAAAAPSGPLVTTRTEVQTREIPFETRMVRDPSLPHGAQQVQTPGIAGEQTLRYLVTLTGGRPTSRRLLDTVVTRQPQPEIVAFGGRYAPDPAPAPDRWRRHCGEGLDLCDPLGHNTACRPEDRRRDEENAIELGGSVSVQDSDLAVLSTGAGAC